MEDRPYYNATDRCGEVPLRPRHMVLVAILRGDRTDERHHSLYEMYRSAFRHQEREDQTGPVG